MTRVEVERLRELLAYNPETGELTWLPRPREIFPSKRAFNTWNARYAGKTAFITTDTPGYRQGRIFGKHYLAHRVAWALVHGEWPAEQIDHVNGIRSDNRLSNLRAVSRAENGRNQKRRSTNTSGVTGVQWVSRGNKWEARIQVAGRNRHLGYFASKDDAIIARKAAELEYGYHANHGRAA